MGRRGEARFRRVEAVVRVPVILGCPLASMPRPWCVGSEQRIPWRFTGFLHGVPSGLMKPHRVMIGVSAKFMIHTSRCTIYKVITLFARGWHASEHDPSHARVGTSTGRPGRCPWPLAWPRRQARWAGIGLQGWGRGRGRPTGRDPSHRHKIQTSAASGLVCPALDPPRKWDQGTGAPHGGSCYLPSSVDRVLCRARAGRT